MHLKNFEELMKNFEELMVPLVARHHAAVTCLPAMLLQAVSLMSIDAA
jgi:hypothetical protein